MPDEEVKWVAQVSITPPLDDGRLLRWLNKQHTGAEIVPLDTKVSEEHREATYAFHRSTRLRLEFAINKKGEIRLIGEVT
jgi:hypothetical protein